MKRLLFIFMLCSMTLESLFGQRSTGIPCNPGTFWANDGAGTIIEYTLSGSTITPTGVTYAGGNTTSLLYGNNLSGSAFSPTFYSPEGNYLYYFDGASWSIIDSLTYAVTNGGGHGDDLYFVKNMLKKIIHYGVNGYDTLYSTATGSISIADISVDQAGNIYFGEYKAGDDSLIVMSPSGNILKKFDLSISNYAGAYGSFLLNGTFYIGYQAGTIYPSSLLPITFSNDSAIIGTPINFPGSGNFFDLEGCDPGLPLNTAVDEVINVSGGISIIPNPSDGNFILNGAPIHSTLKIYDVAGRIIYLVMIETSSENLQLKAQDGVYFLELISGDKFARKKIVIKN